MGEWQLLWDLRLRRKGDARGLGLAGGVLQNGVHCEVGGVAGHGLAVLGFPLGQVFPQALQIPFLEHGLQGRQPVGGLVAHGRLLTQALLQRAVVLHHQLVFQLQGAVLHPGLQDGPHHLPGGEHRAHNHQPQGELVEQPVPVARGDFQCHRGHIPGQVAALAPGDAPACQEQPHAAQGGKA